MSGVRPIWLVILLLALVSGGSLGYHLIEGWNVSDSVYMTLMVLTTVGFGEVHPLSTAGEWFTDLLMVVGIGLMLYLLSQLAEHALRGVLDPATAKRRKERRLSILKHHTLVCGYGQVGEAVCAALLEAGRTVVVIDDDPARLESATTHGLHVLEGDATDEDVLKRAGIEKADALVSVISSDPVNLYVVLSARGLVPGLSIIARASDESAARKMRRAGASEVVNPYQLSGNRIAGLMLEPGAGAASRFQTREVDVPPDCVGLSAEQFGVRSGALVLAIGRGPRTLSAGPGMVLQRGDHVLLAEE